jgi:hypothetical protein
MKKIKILSSAILLLLIMIPILSVQAEVKGNKTSPSERPTMIRATTTRPTINATSTLPRLENRVNNIERIRDRIASSTASTSEKKLGKFNDQVKKQTEQMERMRERIINRELKVIDVLEKISNKIRERIIILQEQGLNMTPARTKLTEATNKIGEMTNEANKISAMLAITITETNSAQIFQAITDSQKIIKTLAKETHTLLRDTIKEITKVLPRRPTATTTATSTATTGKRTN